MNIIKSNGIKIYSTELNGEKITTTTEIDGNPLFNLEREDIQGATITVTDVGAENIYFDFTNDAGATLEGFIK